MIRSLYSDREVVVRTQYGDREWVRTEWGVKQGCILTSFLFNLYAEVITRNSCLGDSDISLKIGGVNNLRYADDIISRNRG